MTLTEKIRKPISCDIIVWNGIVTEYHFVKYLIQPGDHGRLATESEKEYYLLKKRANGK